MRSHPPKSLILVVSIARFFLAMTLTNEYPLSSNPCWILPPAGCLHLLNCSHSLLKSVPRHLKSFTDFLTKFSQAVSSGELTLNSKNL